MFLGKISNIIILRYKKERVYVMKTLKKLLKSIKLTSFSPKLSLFEATFHMTDKRY